MTWAKAMFPVMILTLLALVGSLQGDLHPFGTPAVPYPELLRQAHVEGRVVVRAVVDTAGRVVPESVRVLASAHVGFDEAVRRAVRGWWFGSPALRTGPVPVAIEVWFLATGPSDVLVPLMRSSCDHCDRELEPLGDALDDRAKAAARCGRLLERWHAASSAESLNDTLRSVLQCADAPAIAPLVIRRAGGSWRGDPDTGVTVATMGFRFRTADALLAAAGVAEDSTLPVAGRVYGFQVLALLIHPKWTWRLDLDGSWNERAGAPERGCGRLLILSHPPEDWGVPWPVEAEAFGRRLAERTLARRGVPGPVRVAAYCLRALLSE